MNRHNARIRKQSASFAAAQASTPRHENYSCDAWLWRGVVAHMIGENDLLIDAISARSVLEDAAYSKEVCGTFGTTWKFMDGSTIFADETHDAVTAPRRGVVAL